MVVPNEKAQNKMTSRFTSTFIEYNSISKTLETVKR